MQPVQSLSDHYFLAWDVDMKRDKRLNLILQVVGLGWMILAGGLLSIFVLWMRADLMQAVNAGASVNLLTGLLWILVIMVFTITIHELVHGLFFWLFAQHRPQFGLGPGYAFAALPDWYFPKKQYLVIGLSPLVVLTVVGLAWCAIAPVMWIGWIFTGVVINAGGAIGDLYVCWRITREAGDVWVKDTGDGFQVYRRRVE
jgi:hypothetical protein